MNPRLPDTSNPRRPTITKAAYAFAAAPLVALACAFPASAGEPTTPPPPAQATDPSAKVYTPEEAWKLGWPMMHGPFGNFLPARTGVKLVADLKDVRVVWDLEGHLLWARRLPRFDRTVYAAHWPAPLLSGDVLIVRGALDGMWLTGFDNRTGKQLWDTRIAQTPNMNHGAYASHKVMHLASPGGGTMDVIATNRGAIVRASGGKILGTQPPYTAGRFETAIGHGVSRVASGDLYLSSESGDCPSSPAAVMKVTPVSRDEAKIEQVAVLDSGAEDHGPLKNDPVVLTSKGMVWSQGQLLDLRTGKKAGQAFARGGKSSRACAPVQVGHYIVLNPLSPPAGRAEDDLGLCLCPFGVADISDPAEPKTVASSNLLGGEEMPADIFVDRYLGLTREEKLHLLGLGYPGIAKWFGVRNNGVFASGNRIFLQSAMAVYCIGDPAVKFDWNPASRPEHVTGQLANLGTGDKP